MLIDLRELTSKDSILIDQDISITKEHKQIIKLNGLHLNGKVYFTTSDELALNLVLNGTMTLKDSYTLEPIDYPFSIDIDETYTKEDLNYMKIHQNNQNILDITEILWQNIVLEVPISYTLETNHHNQSGDGWELVDKKKEKEDSRLAVLKELLKEGKE